MHIHNLTNDGLELPPLDVMFNGPQKMPTNRKMTLLFIEKLVCRTARQVRG